MEVLIQGWLLLPNLLEILQNLQDIHCFLQLELVAVLGAPWALLGNTHFVFQSSDFIA